MTCSQLETRPLKSTSLDVKLRKCHYLRARVWSVCVIKRESDWVSGVRKGELTDSKFNFPVTHAVNILSAACSENVPGVEEYFIFIFWPGVLKKKKQRARSRRPDIIGRDPAPIPIYIIVLLDIYQLTGY